MSEKPILIATGILAAIVGVLLWMRVSDSAESSNDYPIVGIEQPPSAGREAPRGKGQSKADTWPLWTQSERSASSGGIGESPAKAKPRGLSNQQQGSLFDLPRPE